MLMLFVGPLSAKLTNYTNADYIPIVDGDVIIWQDFGYLQHTTNLTAYYGIIDETKQLRTRFPLSHMIMLLNSDLQRIEAALMSLKTHHRQARSLNILGTALKVVAGTPDFDDFEQVKFEQQQLIESNNRQMIINTKTQEQINKLTATVNRILESAKDTQMDTGHLYETLLSRNRIVISEIETLLMTITLAKIGVVNPLILDSENLKEIMDKRSVDVNIADLMEVSRIKVLLSNDLLYFLIKYPKPGRRCKKLTLFPVEHNGTILHFAEGDCIAECERQVLAIGNCSATLTSTFCRELSVPTCAQQLHSGRVAHCSTRPSHLDSLMLIDDGMIIINNNTVEIVVNKSSPKIVTGTYLLTYEDEVQINGSIYKNEKGLVKGTPNPSSASTVNITGHQEILSLSYLNKLNTINLRHIGEIKDDLVKRPVISGAAVAFILLVFYATLKLYRAQKSRRFRRDVQVAIDSYSKAEDGSHLSEGGVNTTMD